MHARARSVLVVAVVAAVVAAPAAGIVQGTATDTGSSPGEADDVPTLDDPVEAGDRSSDWLDEDDDEADDDDADEEEEAEAEDEEDSDEDGGDGAEDAGDEDHEGDDGDERDESDEEDGWGWFGDDEDDDDSEGSDSDGDDESNEGDDDGDDWWSWFDDDEEESDERDERPGRGNGHDDDRGADRGNGNGNGNGPPENPGQGSPEHGDQDDESSDSSGDGDDGDRASPDSDQSSGDGSDESTGGADSDGRTDESSADPPARVDDQEADDDSQEADDDGDGQEDGESQGDGEQNATRNGSVEPAPDVGSANVTVVRTPEVVGQPLVVNATTTNEGTEAGRKVVQFEVEHEVLERESFVLQPNETRTVQFRHVFETPGNKTFEVDTGVNRFVTVEERRPSLSVSAVEVTPESVEAGGDVTITASVRNDGYANGTLPVALELFGEVAAVENVTLATNESTQVTFSRSVYAPGSYEAAVENETAAFRVTDSQANRTTSSNDESVLESAAAETPGFGLTVAVLAGLVAVVALALGRRE